MKLYKHQLETIEFGVKSGSYADLSEMGTGKTLSTLSVIKWHLDQDKTRKALVIAPKSIIISGWVRDCHKGYPELEIIPVVGSTKEKLALFNTPADIYVTNYETFHQNWDFSDIGFQILVCDEAVKLKNHRAQWTQSIKNFSETVPYKIIISGLITPNNLMEIFSPFHILHPGILGKSYWQFRGRYFTPDPWSYMNREYIPKKDANKEITDLLKPLIIRHTKEQCLDLPDKIHNTREVEMTPKQIRYYKEMEKDALVELAERDVKAVTKATMLMKLGQIASGVLYDENSDSHHFDSGKIKELDNLLDGELSGEQVLIFLNFKAEINFFREKFPNESFITGGQKATDQNEQIENFKAGKTRLCFASISASKYGITLTNTSNVIYFSINYSLDDFAQSQDRIHRIGQLRTCNYIYLLSTLKNKRKSVDHRIYDALMHKKSLNELMISLLEEE